MRSSAHEGGNEMKEHARAVVIGGGVVGCSVLYHLARAGWTDVMLIERSELTSGSSWHAAGGFHTLNGDPNVAKLQAYTVQLYKELEEISGQSCGLHLTGGVMLADSPERMDFLRLAHAKGRYLGMETELITPSEAKAMFPLMDETNFVGALWDPVEGNLDPSGTTHAYARAARKLGAEIVLRNRVVELAQEPDGTWNVVTEQGTVRAEHVVNAGGLWAREVGRMVGLELPVLAMEHMYLLTEPMPEVEEFNARTGREMVGVLDFKGEIYTRQERNGVLLGTYEKACRPWSPVTTPWDFGHELLAPDLDRIAPSLEVGFRHFPGIENAGIKQIINGPFTFAPDGNPLVGPVPGLTNYWTACAVMAGFSQGGGVGLALSEWMVNGDPGADIWGMDVARFGEWATLRYTNAKVRENYSRRFSIRFPNEELPAARPQQTTPLYDIMLSRGAVMGDSWGLETPLWFAPEGVEPKDVLSYHRSNDFEHVGNEVRAVRERVGVTEIANFAKYEVTGEGAEDWLNRLMTNTMPKTGRIILTPMLNERGKLIGDFTIAKAAEGRFMVWGSSAAQRYHMRWFRGAAAGRRLGQGRPARHEAGRAVDRRAEVARGARKARRRGHLEGRLPLHGLPRNGGRRRAVHGQPHHLYRRPRLRDMDGAGLSAQGLSGAPRSRRRVRHRRFRHARPPLHAARKELPDLVPRIAPDLRAVRGRARPLRQALEERLHRPRGRRPREGRGSEADARLLRRRGRRTPTSWATNRCGRRSAMPTTARWSRRTATARHASAPMSPPRSKAARACATATGASSAGSRPAATRTMSASPWRRPTCRRRWLASTGPECSRSRSSAIAAPPTIARRAARSTRPGKGCAARTAGVAGPATAGARRGRSSTRPSRPRRRGRRAPPGRPASAPPIRRSRRPKSGSGC